MRNIFKFLFVLFMGVICCACVNTVAVHELNQKANKYLEDGNKEAAIARLEASVDLDANIYESRYNLASAYISIKKCEPALEHIEAAVELNKKEPIVHYTLGVAALCVADMMKENLKEGTVFSDSQQARYVELIKKSNEGFSKYVTLAPGAEDVQSVLDVMKNNEAKIGLSSSNY